MHPRKPIKPPLRNHIHNPHSKSSPSPTSKLLLISMASLLCLGLLSLLLFFSISSASHHHNHHHNSSPPPQSPADSAALGEAEIIQACKATRFPGTCQVSLLSSGHVPPNPTPFQIIQSVTWVSSDNLVKAQSMVQAILESSTGNPNRTTAAKNCLETLHNSEYRLNLTSDTLTRARIKDGRAWLSAALAYQYDCWSGLKYVNDTQMVNETMSFMNTLVGYSSNALSMLASYDVYGNETDRWGLPMTERDGFWGGGDGSGGSGSGSVRFPTDLKVDVTVCKSGGGCKYETVQEAVDAAPENSDRRFVIWIKEGVYEETVRVGLEKRNVVFLGDGMGKSVITGSLNVGQPGISTYNTATVGKSNSYFTQYFLFRFCIIFELFFQL